MKFLYSILGTLGQQHSMYVHGEDTRRRRAVQSTHFHSVWCIWSVMCYMFAKQSEGRRREADRESLNFRTAAKEGTQQKKKLTMCVSQKSSIFLCFQNIIIVRCDLKFSSSWWLSFSALFCGKINAIYFDFSILWL